MPTIPLTEAHHALHRLAGEWRGQEQIAPSPWDPQGATAEGVVRNRIALDGLVVIQEYEQIRAGTLALQGHGVFSVEGTEIVLRWWDNWSAAGRTFRGFAVGETLHLESNDPKGAARATWQCGTSRYSYTLEVPQGDGWYTYITATYAQA